MNIKAGKKVAKDSAGARVGGLPLLGASAAWPTCKTCSGPMQFLLQVPLDAPRLKGRTLAVFQCQNQPGLCEEWDPKLGGNAALLAEAASAAPLEPPKVKKTKGANPIVLDALALVAAKGESQGTLGGKPEWIQADETPKCRCGKKMVLAAQVDEFAHPMFNFGGGGRAYAFACAACKKHGALVWQS